MNTYGEVIAAGSLRLERRLPGPIERVWAYLTESEKRQKWLAAGEMEPWVGGKVHLHFHNAELAPKGEVIPEELVEVSGHHHKEGTVTEFNPPSRLSFHWTHDDAEASEVVFELFPEADEVLLVITHRQLPDRDTMLSVAGGWHTHSDILENLLRGGELQPFWPKVGRLRKEYTERIP